MRQIISDTSKDRDRAREDASYSPTVKSSSLAGKMTSSTSAVFLTFFHQMALVSPGGKLETMRVRMALGSEGPAGVEEVEASFESSVMWVSEGRAGRGFLILGGAGSVDSGSMAAG